MCDTCGCGDPGKPARMTRLNPDGSHEHLDGENSGHSHSHGSQHGHSHDHGQPHDHPHDHEHAHGNSHSHDHGHEHVHLPAEGGGAGHVIELGADIMGRNNLQAERNRGFFEGRGILALNWVSSPGSGKTTLLERTIEALKGKTEFYILEGDQQSLLDAERISKTGAPVVQVNTGSGCHLDAFMVERAVKALDPRTGGVLMIENVGNLVCPALFDLGEDFRVVVVSITEGEDKPLKYPDMFRTSQVCIINKIDLQPYVDADAGKLRDYALRVNPELLVFEVSARTGEGMKSWLEWLSARAGEKQ